MLNLQVEETSKYATLEFPLLLRTEYRETPNLSLDGKQSISLQNLNRPKHISMVKTPTRERDDNMNADDPMSEFFLDKPLSIEKKEMKRGLS